MTTRQNPLFPLLLGFTFAVVHYGAFGDRGVAMVRVRWEQCVAVPQQREVATGTSP